MLETSLGGVSALLGDQASGVAVESGSRAQLLSSRCSWGGCSRRWGLGSGCR